MRLAPVLGHALLLTGCVIGANKYPRARDLAQVWEVDGVRLLAVRAEPPEAVPGQLVTFEALLADPDGEGLSSVWIACPPDEAGGFGCAVDLSAIDPETFDPEQAEELGIIGFEPGFPPSYTPEPELLDGLDETARQEGVYVTVQVAAFPASAIENPDAFNYNEVEVGYKRLVVSEAATPNHNPEIANFLVDGVPVPPGATAHVDSKQLYQLGVQLTAESIEEYEFLTSDGDIEMRVEEPYVSWYCAGGTLAEAFTLYPYTEADWTSPEEPGETTCWAVVRDRRGGMNWAVQALTIH